MKKAICIALLAVACLSISSCTSRPQGELHKAGKIDVLVLKGSYREMGEQYGTLLKKELNENYNGMVKGIGDIEGLTLEDVKNYGEAIYSTYPQKYAGKRWLKWRKERCCVVFEERRHR